MNRYGKVNVRKLLRQAADMMRRETVRRLLAGNDTCCFTTEQFKAYFVAVHNRKFPSSGETVERMDRIHTEQWGRNFLATLPDLVAEVRTDVWAAREPLPGRVGG